MNKRKRVYLPYGLIFTLIIYTFFLSAFFSSDMKLAMETTIKAYPWAAPVTIIGLRMIALVVAPIESGPVALTSLLILPWWQAFLYNTIGIIVGDVICFTIARRFRDKVTARFVALERLHRWQDKINQTNQFWGFLWLRLTTAVACEYVSYAAGLTKLKSRVFLTATIAGELVFNAIFFFVGQFSVMYAVYVYGVSMVLFAFTGVGWGMTKLLRVLKQRLDSFRYSSS